MIPPFFFIYLSINMSTGAVSIMHVFSEWYLCNIRISSYAKSKFYLRLFLWLIVTSSTLALGFSYR